MQIPHIPWGWGRTEVAHAQLDHIENKLRTWLTSSKHSPVGEAITRAMQSVACLRTQNICPPWPWPLYLSLKTNRPHPLILCQVWWWYIQHSGLYGVQMVISILIYCDLDLWPLTLKIYTGYPSFEPSSMKIHVQATVWSVHGIHKVISTNVHCDLDLWPWPWKSRGIILLSRIPE